MIEFFVKRPITTIMFVSVFMLLGFVSYITLGIEEVPDIDFPLVSVNVSYPGATPLEIETQITNKIEDAIAEISEIKKIISFSYEGLSSIMVEFLLHCDTNTKAMEVKDKVEAIINDLPAAAEKPLIEKFDPMLQPVMSLVLYSDTLDGRTIYEYADKVFKNKISAVQDVANVGIFGGMERQINIKLDPILMRQNYMTINDVVRKLSAKNQNIPGGVIDRNSNSLSVRFTGEYETITDIKNTLLSNKDGNQLYLKDIAQITDSFKKIENIARFNKKDVVTLTVNKVSDGNAVNIAKKITSRLDKFRDELPEGMKLEIGYDTTGFIVQETKDAVDSIWTGVLFTAIILFLFTGYLRLTIITSVVIPTSVISTMFLMEKSNFTINMMTLLAIAISIGTLIANAIVILEHVLEKLEEGEDAYHAAIKGTKRAAFAVIASAGTNLVVFTPIAFMGGIIGKFMESFGLTVVYATVFSLIASFSLTPMLCAILLTNFQKTKDKKHSIFNPLFLPVKITQAFVKWIYKEYTVIYKLITRFPITTIILCLVSVWSLKFIMPYIGSEFYPNSDQNMVNVKITMPQGTTIDKTSEVTLMMEKEITVIPEVKNILSTIGENGLENANIFIDLIDSHQRERSDTEIINSLIPFAAKIPDAEISFSQVGGAGDDADIEINIVGEDYNKMVEISQKMKDIMETTGYFRSITSSHKYPKTEINFIPNQEKLMQYGIENNTLGQTLRAAIYGDDTNIYKENGEEYDINIEMDTRYKQTSFDLKEIDIMSTKGLIPIVQLGKAQFNKARPTIKHQDRRRIINLSAYLSKSTAGYVQNMLDKEFKAINFPKNYSYKYVGSAEHQEESNIEMSKAFILAVLLTFMLLAAVLNSFIYPISIGSTIITSFVGVFLGLFFYEKSINLASMLGMIMLVGLVVNDAILLVEYSVYKMKEGLDVEDAMASAVKNKFKPILITSASIMAGTLPQMWSVTPLKNAMATVIIGGMAAATFFTFMCVPAVFIVIERIRRFIKHTYARFVK